jgi:hypothetical protein
MRMTPRTLVLSTAAVALGLVVPRAGAALGGQSDPIGLAVYADAGTYVCSDSQSYDDTGYGGAFLCGYRHAAAEAGVPGAASPEVVTRVYAGFYRCDYAAPDCTGETHVGEVGLQEFQVDPALRDASVKGDVDGCAVDVSFTATSNPQEGGELYRSVGGDGRLLLSVNASEGVNRGAAVQGSVCGHPLTGQVWGGLGHGVSARIEGSLVDPT